jgi:uncharacterized protein (TIGR04222 family)
LAFYAVVCLVAISAAMVIRAVFRAGGEVDKEASLSHYEVACLARGVPGVLQAALAALVAGGRLWVVEIVPRKWGPITLGKTTYRLQADRESSADVAVEQALVGAALVPDGIGPHELLEAARPAAESVETELQLKGLLESQESFHSARWWPVLVVAAVWMLGAAKVGVGIWRDKPVVFLLLGLFVLALVLVWLWRLPRRTRAGELLYREIENGHEELRHLDVDRSQRLGTPEMVLAAGLFGLAAIDHPDIQKLTPAIASVPSSYGGTGCGADCGGGGCGGGCGGCGGCGG